MATSLNMHSMLDRDLSCPVCFNSFTDEHEPKELQCQHVQCAPCLKKIMRPTYGAGYYQTKSITCPECRAETHITKGGLENLKTNSKVRSLAISYADHLKAVEQTICPKHLERIRFYCQLCNVTGCSTCFIFEHRSSEHCIKAVEQTYEDQSREMTVTLKKASKILEKYNQDRQQMEAQQQNLHQELKDKERKTDDATNAKIQNMRKLKQVAIRQILHKANTETAIIRQRAKDEIAQVHKKKQEDISKLKRENECKIADIQEAAQQEKDHMRQTYQPKLHNTETRLTRLKEQDDELQRSTDEAKQQLATMSQLEYITSHNNLLGKLNAMIE